jgi:DNA modification methylase
MTTNERFEVITADSLDALKEMPDGIVSCVVTSPPY